MNFSKIDVSLISPRYHQPFTWSRRICHWLGRLWSLCTLPIIGLINKVYRATCLCFSKKDKIENPVVAASIEVKQQVPPQLLLPKSSKEKVNKPEVEIDYDLSLLFPPDDKESLGDSFAPVAVQHPIITQTVAEEVSNPLSPPNLASTSQDATASPKHKGPELVTEEVIPRFTKFKRRKGLNETSSSSHLPPQKPDVPLPPSQPAAAPAKKVTPPQTRSSASAPVKKSGPLIIDNAGGGNCQLHAILKGLEMQYPTLLQCEEKGRSVTLTHQKLRQMGVEFAREQIDKCGKYAVEVLGYVDSDRKEYNQSKAQPVQKKMGEELAKIEKDFKDQKITPSIYEERKREHQEKYSKIMSKLEKEAIKTDADFLTQLEKDGFYCSTLHLFGLSVLLQLPIQVLDQLGVKDHNIQVFNPTNSEKAPIHLYRVGNIHYKYIFYPKT